MTITAVNKSFNKYTLGPSLSGEVVITINSPTIPKAIPSLSGEVVITINSPTIPKAIDAQTKTFVVIFCMIIVYHLKHPLLICSTESEMLESKIR
ncbi:MAG: hypothetical protein UW43_C0001G0022 [Candidatus Yanofskybacteria bacterium GW2011_GWA1_44_21]|nr:MAG: hypothetical protein UW43_C0001G0022 [Candidatus Yanofskybacteria bacterium GW2011_GWA1_44_21]